MFLPGSSLTLRRTRNHIICQEVIACEVVTVHVLVCVHMIEERMEGKYYSIVDLTVVKSEAST